MGITRPSDCKTTVVCLTISVFAAELYWQMCFFRSKLQKSSSLSSYIHPGVDVLVTYFLCLLGILENWKETMMLLFLI